MNIWSDTVGNGEKGRGEGREVERGEVKEEKEE